MGLKFVIWGRGNQGNILLSLLGNDRVAAFIESDPKLQNTDYQNIPVISYDTYKNDFIHYPVIVSPRASEKEILDRLFSDGIWWAFSYAGSEAGLMGFLRQAPLEVITKSLEKNELLGIYGFNPLGLVMYDYFTKKGHPCRLLLQDSIINLMKTNKDIDDIKLNIQSDTVTHVRSGQRVLLAAPVEAADEKVLRDRAIMEKYDDLSTRKNLYYYPELEKFKNLHEDGRCFIVATGPSLRISDLDVLHRNRKICISLNGIFKAFNRTKWRPDYYVITDPNGVTAWKQDILAMDVKEKFVSDNAWSFKKEEVKDGNIHKWHHNIMAEKGCEPRFSDDFSRITYSGTTVVYDGALQLAVYMGFKEIYLLGTDCEQESGGKVLHFVDNYAPGPSHLHLDSIMLAYQSAKRYADAHGIKIYNATRGGALEVFERVDFDSLFENKYKDQMGEIFIWEQ